MAHPGNAVVAGILEYSYLLMSIYMVVIHPVSLDCTIYMLGVFAIEISRLIVTCPCLLFKTRHNTNSGLLSTGSEKMEGTCSELSSWLWKIPCIARKKSKRDINTHWFTHGKDNIIYSLCKRVGPEEQQISHLMIIYSPVSHMDFHIQSSAYVAYPVLN